MKKRVISAALAAVLFAPAASWAITEAQLLKVSEAVFAIEDPAVRAAYLTLRQAHCLDADGKDGDLKQMVTFHVLEKNDAKVSEAFKLLVDRKVFGGAATPTPVAGLTAADLAQLERVKQAIANCRSEQSGLSHKFSRLTQFGWVRERAELPGMISSQLDTMGSYYIQARDLFKPLAAKQDPAVVAMGAEVDRCQREMESWYDRYNNWASSQ